MRASRSPRRSLPGFSVDMALRDMRRKPDPVIAEMIAALGPLQQFDDWSERGDDAMTAVRLTFGELRRIKTAASKLEGK